MGGVAFLQRLVVLVPLYSGMLAQAEATVASKRVPSVAQPFVAFARCMATAPGTVRHSAFRAARYFPLAVDRTCSVAEIAAARATLMNDAIRLSALTASLIAAPLTGEINAA